jgi:hypothetical protein
VTNQNCLESIRCPNCHQEERFHVVALISCLVTDNGSEPVGDHEWDDDSSSHCPECGFRGKLADFRKPSALPPDPDNLNDDRSAWAGFAWATFMRLTGIDEEDALGDLLADLMHWCDRNHYDFQAALIRARGHYEAETLGEDVT